MHDVFLSYKSEERELVLPILGALLRLGLNVWFDQQMETGKSYDEQLAAKLLSSKAVVVCWSRKAVASEWVRREATWADLNGIIAPVFLEDITPPDPLSRIEGARLLSWTGDPSNREWLLLLRRLEKLVGRNDLVHLEEKRLNEETTSKSIQLSPKHFVARHAARSRRRILSIDAGGPNSMISLSILSHMEKLLAARAPEHDRFRLSDYFDLIGGTSTGGIIAGGLAIGHRVSDIREFLVKAMPRWRRKSGLFARQRADVHAISADIRSFFGEIKLDDDRVRTGLAICVKRADDGHSWIISNNPKHRFWDSQDSRTGDFLNKNVTLSGLLEGTIAGFGDSSARMVDFSAERTQAAPVMDGTYSGLANPSMQLLMTAVLPMYGQNWKVGIDNMFFVSVGTGAWPERTFNRGADKSQRVDPQRLLESFAADTIRQGVAYMQFLGKSNDPWWINPELDPIAFVDLQSRSNHLFQYERFDADVRREELSGEVSRNILERRSMNVLQEISEFSKIGAHAAYRQVRPERFPAIFDIHYEY